MITKKQPKSDNQPLKRNLFIIFIILIIILLILLNRCGGNKNQDQNLPQNQDLSNINSNDQNVNAINKGTNQPESNKTDDEFPDLSGCTVGMETDYHSFKKVNSNDEAKEVFEEYIAWAQENHKEVFSGKGNNWQVEKAEPRGIYQGIKYWKITGLWFSEEKQEWLPQTVLSVNQNGKVVRLLGCI